MSRQRLIEQMVKDHGLEAAEADKQVDNVFGSIKRVLERGKVIIKDFGIFSLGVIRGRQRYNPMRDEHYTTQDREVVKFKDNSK